jgi:hypothetical protein
MKLLRTGMVLEYVLVLMMFIINMSLRQSWNYSTRFTRSPSFSKRSITTALGQAPNLVFTYSPHQASIFHDSDNPDPVRVWQAANTESSGPTSYLAAGLQLLIHPLTVTNSRIKPWQRPQLHLQPMTASDGTTRHFSFAFQDGSPGWQCPRPHAYSSLTHRATPDYMAHGAILSPT